MRFGLSPRYVTRIGFAPVYFDLVVDFVVVSPDFGETAARRYFHLRCW